MVMQRPKSVMRGDALKNHLSRTVLALAAAILLLGLDASAQTSAKVYRIIGLDTGQPNLRSHGEGARPHDFAGVTDTRLS